MKNYILAFAFVALAAFVVAGPNGPYPGGGGGGSASVTSNSVYAVGGAFTNNLLPASQTAGPATNYTTPAVMTIPVILNTRGYYNGTNTWTQTLVLSNSSLTTDGQNSYSNAGMMFVDSSDQLWWPNNYGAALTSAGNMQDTNGNIIMRGGATAIADTFYGAFNGNGAAVSNAAVGSLTFTNDANASFPVLINITNSSGVTAGHPLGFTINSDTNILEQFSAQSTNSTAGVTTTTNPVITVYVPEISALQGGSANNSWLFPSNNVNGTIYLGATMYPNAWIQMSTNGQVTVSSNVVVNGYLTTAVGGANFAGRTNGAATPSLMIGQVVSTSINLSSAQICPVNVLTNVMSVSVGNGLWLAMGGLTYTNNANALTNAVNGMSTNGTATLPATAYCGYGTYETNSLLLSYAETNSLAAPIQVFNISQASGQASIYISTIVKSAGSGLTYAGGWLTAIRIN